MTQERDASADARGQRFCLIAARFHERYVDRLLEGALAVLRNLGAVETDLEVVRVPGALELPLACRWAASSARFDAIVALGVVIRGETDHFRLVADGSSNGLLRVSLETGVPIVNGVLAAFTAEQAAARSGGERGNRGAEAALAAVQMAQLRRRMTVGQRNS